jgi:hypothetical protein
MTTLYKNTRRIAATIVATMVLSAGTAVAVTSEAYQSLPVAEYHAAESVGKFVVTPNTMKLVPPAETVGRFVVSQHGAVFVPGQVQASV